MTVTNTSNKAQYNGNGVTTAFAFPYVFFLPSDLVVSLYDTVNEVVVSPAPVLNGAGTFDYTVNGTLDPASGEYLTGATVTFNTAPLASYQVTLLRVIAPLQQIALIDNNKFPAAAVNGGLDRLTMIAQQVIAEQAGSIIAPIADPVGLNLTLPPAQVRASEVLAFDSSGNVTTLPASDTSAGIAQAAAASATASASSAQASAATATTEAGIATTAATSASSSATSASGSATTASTAATSATGSATTASTAATTAGTAATNAGNSATAAAGSATAAAGSATTASTAATSAGNSATAAATSATNAAASAASVSPPVGVRQCVLSGIVDANGQPAHVQISGGAININGVQASAAFPFVATAAKGFDSNGRPVDAVCSITSNQASVFAWNLNSFNYCYVDLTTPSAPTFGISTLRPIYSFLAPASPATDQHWFSLAVWTMYRWTGSAWAQVTRTFIASVYISGSGLPGGVTNIAAPFAGKYVGPWISTLPAVATALTAQDGMDTDLYDAAIDLQCLTAENGFAAGNVVYGAFTASATSTFSKFVFTRDFGSATTIRLLTATGANTSFRVIRPDTGALVTPTAANWAYRLRSWRLF